MILAQIKIGKTMLSAACISQKCLFTMAVFQGPYFSNFSMRIMQYIIIVIIIITIDNLLGKIIRSNYFAIMINGKT